MAEETVKTEKAVVPETPATKIAKEIDKMESNGKAKNIPQNGDAKGDKKDIPTDTSKSDAPKTESNGTKSNADGKTSGNSEKRVLKVNKTQKKSEASAITDDADWKDFSEVFGKQLKSKKELLEEVKSFKNGAIVPKHEFITKANTILEKGGDIDDVKAALGLGKKNYAEFVEGKGYSISDEDVTREGMLKKNRNLTLDEINEHIEEKSGTVEFKIRANEYRMGFIEEQGRVEKDFFTGLDLKQNQQKTSKQQQLEYQKAFHADVDKYVENFKDYEGIEIEPEIPANFGQVLKGDWFNELFIKEDKSLDFDALKTIYMNKFTEVPKAKTAAEIEKAANEAKKATYDKLTNYDPNPDKNRDNSAKETSAEEDVMKILMLKRGVKF